MLSNILYISATSCFVIGSALAFDYKEPADYFYLIGSSLFLVKAVLSLVNEIRDIKSKSMYGSI